LQRFPLQPDDVLLADRGYAHTEALVGIAVAGSRFVVRFPWATLPLHGADGAAWDLMAFLRELPDAQADAREAYLAGPGAVQVRVVAVRKSPEATVAARQKILRTASRKGKQVNPLTLEYAAYVFVVTNLTAEIASPAEVLELYRLRWQIEMAFKRLKSILQLDALRGKDPELAKTYLFGKLLGALIVDELTVRAQAFSPWGFRLS
jgi:hypothetical protein